MNQTATLADGKNRMTLAGAMTICRMGALSQALRQELADCAELEVDLAAVTAIDAAGMQWMLAAKFRRDRRVCFVNHSPVVLDALAVPALGYVLDAVPHGASRA